MGPAYKVSMKLKTGATIAFGTYSGEVKDLKEPKLAALFEARAGGPSVYNLVFEDGVKIVIPKTGEVVDAKDCYFNVYASDVQPQQQQPQRQPHNGRRTPPRTPEPSELPTDDPGMDDLPF
jgi:hypothetical protein